MYAPIMESICWREIFRVKDDLMDLDDEEESSAISDSTAYSSSASFTEQKMTCINTQLKGLMHDPVLSVSILSSKEKSGVKIGRRKLLHKFDLTVDTDETRIENYIQGLDYIKKMPILIQVDWNGSIATSGNHQHRIFKVLDWLNTLEMITELRVSSFQSNEAAIRLSHYLRTNRNLSTFQLGYHMKDSIQVEESAEILGAALATNSSLRDFRLLPFSASTDSNVFQDSHVDRALNTIFHDLQRNMHLKRLHLWAPGVIPSSIVRATLFDHPSITELYLDGETAPWYRGKGVDQYHEFQYLVWEMLRSPSCHLEKLKLHNFHLNTRTVDVLLSSLWKGHPLEVLDVSGNFLSSLSFPRFLEQIPYDESNEKRLRLLIVENQSNTFASLEYDLTYQHDKARCRQHCHDLMRLVSTKPGLSIQHSKIPAMLSAITILPTVLPSPTPSRPAIRFTSTDQLQYLLDHHRLVPPPIRYVNEDFCLSLWPLILERSTDLLAVACGGKEDSRRAISPVSAAARTQRQASVMYQLFQDWSLILLQGSEPTMR